MNYISSDVTQSNLEETHPIKPIKYEILHLKNYIKFEIQKPNGNILHDRVTNSYF